MTPLRIGQMVVFTGEPGTVYAGNVVSYDDGMVALAFVEQVLEEGNRPHPNPILFVARGDVRPVEAVGQTDVPPVTEPGVAVVNVRTGERGRTVMSGMGLGKGYRDVFVEWDGGRRYWIDERNLRVPGTAARGGAGR